MPIVFEQPAPMAPEITAGGGQAEQFSKDLPSLVSLYNNQASNRQAGRNAAIAAGSHMQAAMIGAAVDEDRQATQERMQSEELASRQRMQQDQFGYQSQLAQQHAQNQMQMQGMALSQQEQMQLSQLQNSIGAIQQAKNQGLIDGPTAEAAIAKQFGVMNPMLQRQEAAKAKLLEAQTNEVARQEKVRADTDKWWAENAQDGVAYIDDGNGRRTPVMRDAKGGFFQPKFDNAETKQQEAAQKEVERAQMSWDKTHAAVEGQVDRQMRQEEKQREAAAKAAKEADESAPAFQPTPADQWAADRAKRVQAAMVAAGQPISRDAVADRVQNRRLGQTEEPPLAQATPQQQPEATGPGQPIPASPMDAKPFVPGHQETMNPIQVQQISILAQTLNAIQELPIAPERKGEAISAIHAMHGLLAEYGSEERMKAQSEDAYKKYEGYKRFISRLPSPKSAVEADRRSKLRQEADRIGANVGYGGYW